MLHVDSRATGLSKDISVYLEKVSELGVDTTEIEVYDMKWNLVVERIGDDVSVFLHPITKINFDLTITIEIEESEGKAPYKKQFKANFLKDQPTKIGDSKFITWNEFVGAEREFVVDDVASFNIHFSGYRPCGCCSGGHLAH